MRYVLIRDDASLEDIDEGLRSLVAKRDQAKLEVIRDWISEDIEELLGMRSDRMADAASA